MLIAFIADQPVGFLYFTLDFMDYTAAYIELIFVSSKSRRLGAAKKLLDKAEEIIMKAGYSKVFSSTNPDNKISLKMHKKLGYKRCGFIDGIETPTSKEIFFSKELKS